MMDWTKYIRIVVMLAVCCTSFFSQAMLRTSSSVLNSKPSVLSKVNISANKLAPMIDGTLKFAQNLVVRASENMTSNPKSCGIILLVCLAAMGYKYLPVPDMSGVKGYCKKGWDWVFEQCYNCLPLEAQQKVIAINTVIVAPVSTLIVSPVCGYILNADNCKYVVFMAMCALAGQAAGWPNTGYVGAGTVFAYSLLLGGVNRVEKKVDAGFVDTRKQLKKIEQKIVDAGKINHQELTNQIKGLDEQTQQSILGVATQINEVQKKLLDIDKNNSDLGRQLNEQLGQANIKIDKIQDAFAQTTEQLTTTSTNVKDMQSTLNKLEKEGTVRTGLIEELKGCVKAIEDDMNSKYTTLTNKFDQVHEDFEKRLITMEKGQVEVKEKVANLAEVVEKNAEENQKQLNDLNKQAQGHKEQLDANGKQMEGCIDHVKSLEKQVQNNADMLEKQGEILQEVNLDGKKTVDDIKKLHTTMDVQSKMLQGLQDSARAAAEKQKETDQKISAQAEEIAKLKTAMEKMKETQQQLKEGQDRIKMSVDENIREQKKITVEMSVVKKELIQSIDKATVGQKTDMQKLAAGLTTVAHKMDVKLDEVLATVHDLQFNGSLPIDLAPVPSTQAYSMPIASSYPSSKAPVFKGTDLNPASLQFLLNWSNS